MQRYLTRFGDKQNTMTIKEAIQKAVGKGYKDYIETASSFDIDKERSDILLDPSFWQALGKSLGWEAQLSTVST